MDNAPSDNNAASGESLSPAAKRRHRRACDSGELGYEDPETGLFVLTSVYLKQQGSCCGGGCRHCPWPEAEQSRAGRPPDAPAWPYLPDGDSTSSDSE